MAFISTMTDRVGSKDNNFTLLRLIAAYAVLVAHSYDLSLGHSGGNPINRLIVGWWGWGLGTSAVAAFFVMSGFLVGASYLHRQNLFAFIEARGLRIFPGLIVAVIFCALIVGPWATVLPVADYLSHPQLWSFIGHNITLFGGASYRLPGVFADNPWAWGVNGSLWTLPLELYMYCMVAILGVSGILKSRLAFNMTAILACVFLFALTKRWINIGPLPFRHAPLVMAYLSGVFFYINRGAIPINKWMPGLVILLMVLLHGTELWSLVKIFGYSYLVLFLALLPSVRGVDLDRWGDISYGVYIYAFPVQQLVIKYISQSPLVVLAYASVITMILAIASWRWVESPALKLKGRMSFGRKWLDPRVRSGSK